MPASGHGYRYLTIDGIAVSKPCNLVGIVFTPTTAADYITVYDGSDTSSGRVVARVDAATVTTVEVLIPGGVYCPGGVYVDFSAASGKCTIVYDTVETV